MKKVKVSGYVGKYVFVETGGYSSERKNFRKSFGVQI